MLVNLARYTVALLFVFTGGAKLLRWRGFAAALKGFKLLPNRLVALFGLLLPVMELAIGVSIFSKRMAPGPELAAAALLLGFTVAMVHALLTGKRGLQCGCFGSIRKRKILLDYGAVITNVALVGVCVVAAGLPALTLYQRRLTLVLAATWIGLRPLTTLVLGSEAPEPRPSTNSMT